MPLFKSDAYTIDYIYNLPDGQRAELIDGRMTIIMLNPIFLLSAIKTN